MSRCGILVNIWCLFCGFAKMSSEEQSNLTTTQQLPFTAALVDFPVVNTKGTNKQLALREAKKYGLYAWHASVCGADVIVFPGNVLEGSSDDPVTVDVPPVGTNLCKVDTATQGYESYFRDLFVSHSSGRLSKLGGTTVEFLVLVIIGTCHNSPVVKLDILGTLSCIANTASIFMVASVKEKFGNEPCNSQVVFDKDGQLIAVHRNSGCSNVSGDNYFILRPYGLKVGLLFDEDLFDCDFLKEPVLSHYVLSLRPEDKANDSPSWLAQVKLWLADSYVLVSDSRNDVQKSTDRMGIYAKGRRRVCSPYDDLMIAQMNSGDTENFVCRCLWT